MTRQKIFVIVVALMGASVSHTLARDRPCGTNKPAIVNLAEDGHILWDRQPVTFDEAMRRFSVAVKSDPIPNIQIVPDRMAKYDAVAKFLSHVQMMGFHCVGFVGNNSGH